MTENGEVNVVSSFLEVWGSRRRGCNVITQCTTNNLKLLLRPEMSFVCFSTEDFLLALVPLLSLSFLSQFNLVFSPFFTFSIPHPFLVLTHW